MADAHCKALAGLYSCTVLQQACMQVTSDRGANEHRPALVPQLAIKQQTAWVLLIPMSGS
jgi:hypothetical protein